MIYFVKKFPSPCGDYGSYPWLGQTLAAHRQQPSFRPLAGIMVLICMYLDN